MLWLKRRKHNYSYVPFYFLSSTENCLLQPQRLNNKSSYITMNVTFCHFSMQNSTYSFLKKVKECVFKCVSTKNNFNRHKNSRLIENVCSVVTQEMLSGDHTRSRCESLLNENMKLHNTSYAFFCLIGGVHAFFSPSTLAILAQYY